MIKILLLVVSLVASLIADVDRDAVALVRTAPTYLTIERARERVFAARTAGAITGEDPAILEALAWHESRYGWTPHGFTDNVVSYEPGNRVSCGELSPYPIAPPCPQRSILAQYIDGAAHLRTWRGLVPYHPVLGYAGLAGACSAGPVMRGHENLCDFEPQMYERAAWIRREMHATERNPGT